MEEIKCNQVAQINSSGYTEMTGRVYDKNGLSPSIRTFAGGNTEVKVLEEPLAYEEQNGYLREDGIVGTLTTDGSSPKHNNRVVEPKRWIEETSDFRCPKCNKESEYATDYCPNCGQSLLEPIVIGNYHKSHHEASRIISRESISPTVKENHGTITAVDETITNNRFFKQAFETVKENDCDSGDTIDAFNQKVNKSGVSPTVTTRPEGFKTAVLVVDEPLVYDGFNQQVKADSTTSGTITRNVGADLKRNGQGIIEPKQVGFRVRKLTEKECFRLQGVKDEDFAKIRQNQSKSSCYHLAGDSITTSVLMALFGEMLGVEWRSKVNALVEELSEN